MLKKIFIKKTYTIRLNLITSYHIYLDIPNCPENDGQMANAFYEYETMSCNKIQLLQLSLAWGSQMQRPVTACMNNNRSIDLIYTYYRHRPLPNFKINTFICESLTNIDCLTANSSQKVNINMC